MKFDDLDSLMRRYETAQDQFAPPGIYMVARLDGRNFTSLTRKTHDLAHPFDDTFRDHMVETTAHLMRCGFRVVYGFTESDEISLLLHRDEKAFGRKLRKYISILASEASATFTLRLGGRAVFDCRISQLPDRERVIDYFRWRSEDANRNALGAHCYWALIDRGERPRAATDRLSGMPKVAKVELLRGFGIEFDDLPTWQRRGVGLSWHADVREATNRRTGATVSVFRRSILRHPDLPVEDAYAAFLTSLMDASEQELEDEGTPLAAS